MAGSIDITRAKARQRERIFKYAIGFFAAFGLGTLLSLIFVSVYVLTFSDEILHHRSREVFPIADGKALYEEMKEIEEEKEELQEKMILEEALRDLKKQENISLRRSRPEL